MSGSIVMRGFWFCLFGLLLLASVSCENDVAYLERINTCFFQLFAPANSCEEWAENNFSPTATWFHPNLPRGAVGYEEIANFCIDTRRDFPESIYLPKNLPSLTHSGEYSYASVNYFFSSNQPGVPFTNWGNVFFALDGSNTTATIQYAVETWDRRVWPDQRA